MKRIALILVVLFSATLFSLQKSSGYNKNAKDSELVEQLVPIVLSLLQGSDYTEFKENISTEAYLINNNTYESIFEVLSNPTKKEMFVEGKEIKTGFIHLWLPDNEKEAYMVLETKSADNLKISWHSILFKNGENHKWQILSWHKS